MKPPDRPFAHVLWDDAHAPSPTDAYNVEEIERVGRSIPILTAGWVMVDDSTRVVVANEYCGDGDFRGFTIIPRAMVREITYLSLRKKGPSRAKADRRPAAAAPPRDGDGDGVR